MKKTNLTLTFEDEKLEALEFILKKTKGTGVVPYLQQSLEKLYEETVPETLREYLDHKSGAGKPRKPSGAIQKAQPKKDPREEEKRAEAKSEPNLPFEKSTR